MTFLETLLDRDNLNFHKEVNGRTLISPCWSFCLSYEFEPRKEAIRLCKEQAMGVQAALWTALRNPEHRMKHWLQLVAIPNAPSSSSGPEIQALKKRISDLEKARSRSLAKTHRCRQRLLVQLNSLFPHLQLPLGDRKAGKAERTRGNVAKVKGQSVLSPKTSSTS